MTTAADIALNPSELNTFYGRYFKYYTTLDEVCKQLFVKRCLQFVSEKMITGAGPFEPDNRVKALIAASAVQLTLGLEAWQLTYFEEIELHPSDFESTTGNLKFSGETNLQGYIKLSWKSFMRGYTIDDDNLNLGLHEFSHALRFNSIRGDEQDYFIKNYFNKWMCCAGEAFSDIKNEPAGIFRNYGGTNMNEFLSVCIEHYFESPEEIRERYPQLYYATGIFLNQYTRDGITKINIRDEFLEAQNKLLPGFETQSLKSRFLKHWTFKLWLFVFAISLYNIGRSGILNSISLALVLMVACIYAWYDYTAVTLDFDGPEIHVRKGSVLFRNRRHWIIPASRLISIRVSAEEWLVTYYNAEDIFFYEETVHPPKGVSPLFFESCRRNKVALLK